MWRCQEKSILRAQEDRPSIVLALIHLLPVFLQPQPPEGERKDQKSFSTLTGVIYSTSAYTWLEQGDETFGCFQADSAL